jgi:Nif-specific regulatory protein
VDLQNAETRKINELTLLFEISRTLESSLDLREIMEPILKAMADNMGMLRGTLTLIDRSTGDIFIEAAYGLSAKQRERGHYKAGEGVTGKVINSGIPAVVPRISDEPLFLNKTKAREDLHKKDISFICVPIRLENQIIGTLSADRLFSDMVSFEEDVRLLAIIAAMVAQAVKLRMDAIKERQSLLDENIRLQEELRTKFRPANIIGNSKIMRGVYSLIAKVAKSDATVLLRGETGTGKELVAHAIHYNSNRAQKPFIKVNLAALPENIIESELFGHEKGAFTGAIKAREGRLEMANGGTIFLDEIGDLSPATQIKLLRVLQEKEFERVGSNEKISIDIRVIAATNRNLEQLIEEETFRQDLYYRLNVFEIHMPALRERVTDILLLANFFIEKYRLANNKSISRISTPAINLLNSYHWPGNVRELENCIERAVILTGEDVIRAHHLPPTLQSAETTGASYTGSLSEKLESVERELIIEALKEARGNMARAADNLGITERIMGLRVKKYSVDYRDFRNSS